MNFSQTVVDASNATILDRADMSGTPSNDRYGQELDFVRTTILRPTITTPSLGRHTRRAE